MVSATMTVIKQACKEAGIKEELPAQHMDQFVRVFQLCATETIRADQLANLYYRFRYEGLVEIEHLLKIKLRDRGDRMKSFEDEINKEFLRATYKETYTLVFTECQVAFLEALGYMMDWMQDQFKCWYIDNQHLTFYN